MFMGNKPTITFQDVAGVEEAKQELQEVVEFLKYPEKFAALGARIPQGRAAGRPAGHRQDAARRARWPARPACRSSASRGSEFVEMFVGVGASRVRDLFDQAKRNAPCIVFVDEIDAVGRQRGAGLGGSPRRARADAEPDPGRDGRLRHQHQRHRHRRHQPARRARPGAAAARPLRPPGGARPRRTSTAARRSSKSTPRASRSTRRSTWTSLAKQTPGFSGADLANLINEARDPGRPAQQEDHRHVRAGRGDRPRDRRPRAQEPRHLRAREGDHRLPRGRPRHRRALSCDTTTRCTRSPSSPAA